MALLKPDLLFPCHELFQVQLTCPERMSYALSELMQFVSTLNEGT